MFISLNVKIESITNPDLQDKRILNRYSKDLKIDHQPSAIFTDQMLFDFVRKWIESEEIHEIIIRTGRM
jgi:hypothetical protein